MAYDLSPLSVVIAVFAIKSVPERKIIAENKVDITEPIDHLRRVSERDKVRRVASLNIEVLVPSVQWRRKKSSFLPLESLFFGPFVPYAGRPATFENINQLFEEIMLRYSFSARRNLTDIGAAGSARSDETYIDPSAPVRFQGATGTEVRSSTQWPRTIGIPSNSCQRS